jgi:hypothetical protein
VDVTILVALITDLGPIMAVAVSGFINWRMGKSIHTIVNSQRTVMVNEIDSMKAEIIRLKTMLQEIRTSVSSPPR